MDEEGLAKLFFELASDSRLKILNILVDQPLKMQDLARHLDVTATEAFRQLERLSAAMLVARKPEGTYTTTAYGKLVLQMSAPLDFLLKYREYFAAHDVSQLPEQFVNRLNELSGGTFVSDTVESLNRGQRLFVGMTQFGWGIAEGVVPEFIGPVMEQQLQKGVKMKFIIPASKMPPNPAVIPNVEARVLPEIPAVLAVSEKEALVCLRTNEGKMDYTGFFGSDAAFLGWCRDLFLHFWDLGHRP